MNSPTPLPDSSLDRPFQTDSAPLEGPRRHSILDKNSRLSAVRPAEIQEECPKSPALFLASASKHGSEAAVLDLSVHEESKFTENKILLKRNMAALKPAIAPQVGTTRTVLLSKRPKPKKPQSMRPITQSRPRAPKTTAAKEPGPTAVKSQPHRSSPRPPLARAPQTPGSESSEDSEDSDASHSSDTSEESERGKLKRRLGKKGGEVRTESRRPTPLLQSTPTDGGEPGSSAGSSRTRGVRSAAELLEEAEDIARTDPSIHERRIQQRQPEGATLAVKTLMRGRARTVDEIIASLQAGSATDSLSASDLMIKELTERVLGHETEGEAEQKDGVVLLPTHNDLTEWQKIAEYYVERPRMVLLGRQASMYTNESKLFWNPAPPKFTFTPSFVQDKLFPKYQGSGNEMPNVLPDLYCDLQDLNESDQDLLDVQNKTVEAVIWRSQSAPDLSVLPDSGLRVPADFKAIKKEVDVVIKQLSQSKTAAVSEARSPTIPVSKEAESIPADLPEPVGSQSQLMQRQKKENVSLSDVARKAGQTYIIHPRKKSTRKKKLSPEKLAFVERKLNQPPRTLARCESLPALQRRTDPSLRVPKKTLRSRRASLPALLDFEHFAAARGGIPEDAIPREWVRDIWDSWFDEVFPPSDVETGADYPRPTPLYPERRSSIDTRHTDAEGPVPDEVDLSCTLGAEVTASDLQSEVDKLTQVIAAQRGSGAFDLCRRGALLKKLGHLTLALEDLNTVIAREPLLLDAYWHRHSIHLLKRNLGKALEDLNFIIKHNRNHADAFRSKAEIYRAQGDSTLAIINYTQAIKRGPEDDENYFRRAEMYEKTNETLLAMEDYAMAFTINPRRTDALMIHGLHHFRRSNWTVALSDFTALLKQEPRNVEARTYRGRTYAKLSQHREAIEDLSAAIYLDRNNWVAFYLRGCLLRKVHPEMAIKDLSASVLINDSFENLSAFLHRGVLYAEQSRWASAVGDFERVLKLDRCVPVAHVNLGLVYMLKMENHSEAIRRFTNALKVDPTYIRAHICRAQAYAKVRDLPRALKDITHAIHLQPNTHHLYIMRGQYLCDMKDFELARFCIRYAAEMNKALGSSPIQQAAVQSFLGNNARAIACLSSATRTRPSPSAFILLGKTQMKARKYTDAIESFEKVLTPLCPDRDCCSAPDAAEVFYLTGLCHVAQANLLQAVEAFSSAVKISPDSADALYQRGLCRMHLQQSKCVQDFNRALSINPNLFQVYLSRAAFYGSKGRFSKAILNCNEALRIQPRSVRAYLYRGALKFFMKIYRYAVQDLTTAIEIDETCSLAYYNRGVCYQQMKEHGKALKDYGRVQHLGSRKEVELKVLINRGLLYVELNDPNNALQDFKAASRKSPEDASNFHAVGVLHHRLGHLEEATAAFTQALRLRPFFLEAYVGRGNVYMDYGHQDATKQAQRDFLTALHLNPTCAKARLGLAFNFQVLGRFSKAWNQLTIAIEVDPSCWAAYEGRSVINLQMGHTFSAFQDINAALKYNPLSDQLITNRGVINQFMGDKVNAMKDYQAAIAHNPQYALAYFNAANLYFYNRQFEQASEYYSKAFDLDPSDDSAALNRAIARTLLGNVPEALRDFSAACKLNPFSTHVYFNRANLYISVKKYKSAEKDLSQALLLQPNDALVYKLRADVRGKLGSTELAVSDYKKAVRLEEAAQGV
ncbi:uncharacterized protein ttc6 [Amia ocellicauda]|uniref:uncharacterized protein ttc6 n=1 Tax=Amia ocellicauda TaxID=2972642 RepID=UPI00346442BB